jgi:hypothetical protein
MKQDDEAVSRKSELMKALSAELSAAQADGRAGVEISRIITELNEVRMRLDSVVRKIGETAGSDILGDGQVGSIDEFRLKLVDQLDRIREKLVERSRAL